jgi:uncharacterized protein with FMN-binding domain
VAGKRWWIAGLVVGIAGVAIATWHILAVVALKHVEIAPLEVAKVADGTYRAGHGYGLYHTTVEATVAGGRLTRLEAANNLPDPYSKKALVLGEAIVRAQSLEVEAVTGATCSSNAILLATHRALTSPPSRP